jgi:hypothetical protein
LLDPGGLPAPVLDPGEALPAVGEDMKTWKLVGGILGLATLATGCGGSSQPDPVPFALRVVQAPPSAVANGEPLAPVQVLVVDGSGNGVSESGVSVRVGLGDARGSLSGNRVATTDGGGRATFSGLSVTGPVGSYSLVFSSEGFSPATSGPFQLKAGPAAAMRAESPLDQVAPEVSDVASPPTVRVTDLGGNPVSGTQVEFVVAVGGGSVAGTPGTTGADGISRVARWTLGDAGPQGVEARAAGLAGSPVAFTATASPSPAALAVVVQPPASAGVRGTLAPAPAVQLVNARGTPTRVTGVAVTTSLAGGSGSLLGEVTQATDENGLASFPALALGGQAVGPRSLVFAAAGLAGATSQAIQVGPGPASLVSAASPPDQTAEAYAPVSSPPAVLVQDSDGNAVPGTPVEFVATSGGGAVAGSPTASGLDGVARASGWTLGLPGPQAAEARVPGLSGSPVLFAATATPPPPAALRVSAEPPPTATIRVALAPVPAVQLLDAAGRATPRAGVAVTVAMTGGSGSLVGQTTRVSDASGRVEFPGLAFAGLSAGTRSLAFLSPGLAGCTSRAVHVEPGPASQAAAASTLDQTGTAYQPVASPPAVRVRDADGNPVPGAQVSFQVTLGGGSVSGSPATTGADGAARVGSWTLGSAGAQALVASVAGLAGSPVGFTATARSTDTSYDITLRFLLEPPASQRQAFEEARARIEEVVVGDVPSLLLDYGAIPSCGNTAINETVDDLLILVEVGPIDGPGSVLGRAGPCVVRSTSRLPAMGFMRFDSEDLAMLEAAGSLQAVVLHEMMHVLGFGTIWQQSAIALLVGASTDDPHFIGAGARDAFLNHNGGTAYAGTPVPVENTGGPGTVNGHWRESVLASELMTGWVSVGGPTPMSRTTVASMGDIGYVVDVARADPFDLSSALRLRAEGEAIHLVDDVVQVPLLEVDAVSGNVRPIHR